MSINLNRTYNRRTNFFKQYVNNNAIEITYRSNINTTFNNT